MVPPVSLKKLFLKKIFKFEQIIKYFGYKDIDKAFRRVQGNTVNKFKTEQKICRNNHFNCNFFFESGHFLYPVLMEIPIHLLKLRQKRIFRRKSANVALKLSDMRIRSTGKNFTVVFKIKCKL